MANFFNNNILLKLNSVRSQGVSAGSSTVNMTMQGLQKFSTYLQNKLPKEAALLDIISVSDEFFPDYILERPLTLNDEVVVETDLAFRIRHDIIDLYNNSCDDNGYYIVTLTSGDCIQLRINSGDLCYVYDGLEYPFFTESSDAVYLKQVLRTADQGTLVSVWDVLSDLKSSYTMNRMLNDAIATVRSNATISVTDLRTRLQEYTESTLSSVRKATAVVVDAFGKAGFYGAVQAILSFVKSIATVSVGDDGLLEFSNNDSLIPKQYIVGCLAAVFSTLAQVAGLIVTALSKVIGAVMFVAGSVINSVFGAASYDYATKTKARLEGDSNSPLTPYGMSQVEYNITSWETTYGKAKLGNMIPFAISVPGGQVFVSSTENKYRMEFHPDIIDRRGCLFGFTVNGGPLVSDTYVDGGHSLSYNVTRLDVNDELQDFLDCCCSTNPDVLNNGVDGVATDQSDTSLRAIVSCNIMLFLIYLQSISSGNLADMATRIMDLTGPYSIGTIPYNPSNFNCSNAQFVAIANVLYYGVINAVSQHTSTLPAPSWVDISTAVDFLATSDLVYGASGLNNQWIYHNLPIVSVLLDAKYMTDDVCDLPYNLSYCIKIPQYDRGSFWATTIAISLAAAVILTVGVVATIATTKAIRNKKGQNARNLEAQWEQYKKSPTVENLKAYQKSVKKNNLFNKVFGGTQYSREGLWASTDSSESVTSKFCESLLPLSQSEDDQNVSTNQSTLLDAINNVYGSITGTFFTPDNE